MSDKDDGNSMPGTNGLEIRIKLIPGHGIQCGEGLIHQENPGTQCKGPGYGYALFHSSGEFMDTGMSKVVQAY